MSMKCGPGYSVHIVIPQCYIFLLNLSFQLSVGQCFGTLSKVEGKEPYSG